MNVLAKIAIGIGGIVGIVIITIIIFSIVVALYVRNDKQFEYEE